MIFVQNPQSEEICSFTLDLITRFVYSVCGVIILNRIAELRQKRDVSMMQAAKELNIPYTTYVNYEKGDREPNSEMLIKLADYFGVSVDYLIGRSDEMVDERVLDLVSELDMDIVEASKGNLLLAQKLQERRTIDDLKVALFKGSQNVTDEMWQEVVNFARYVEAREAEKNKHD